MLHGVHSTAFAAALSVASAIEAGRSRAYAHAVAARDLAINDKLAAEVLRLRGELSAMTKQRDALATALARRG